MWKCFALSISSDEILLLFMYVVEVLYNSIMSLLEDVDCLLRGRRPSEVILLTLCAVASIQGVHLAFNKGSLASRSYKMLFRGIKALAAPLIRIQVQKASQQIKLPHKEGELRTLELPEKMKSYDEVLQLVEVFHDDLDVSYKSGQLSGTVYHGGDAHSQFVDRVMESYRWSNPLHSDIFGAARKMEAEVVSMVLHMFNGQLLPDGCGALTSGGTESILMAMKTYRDWGRNTRNVQHPSIIVPITAHPAFDKAAEYFDILLIKVPVEPTTMAVNAKELEKYIRYDTIAIVGSACSFPHGAIDPIEEMSEIAVRHGIGLHVDSCLGGFIIPFLGRTGRKLPILDFRNPGVTSISCDTHKYGYGPKGTSVVLYRSQSLRFHQFCSISEWPGGMYCSPAVSGSKPGNVIAATWACMVHMGMEGYVDCCNKIMNAREYMTSEIAKIDYLHIYGDPKTSVFAFGTNFFDIYDMGTELTARGWFLNRLQYPAGLQFSVTMLQTQPGVKEKFIKDLKEVGAIMKQREEEYMRENGKSKPRNGESGASVYGSAQRVPDRTIVQDVLKEYLNHYYKA